jgi:hypothetical protein
MNTYAIIVTSIAGLFLYLCAASMIGKRLKSMAEDYPVVGAPEGAFPADRFGER